jgi:hypothetical protein
MYIFNFVKKVYCILNTVLKKFYKGREIAEYE